MSPIRYPNANYPTAYAEANMVKAGDVAVNDAGSSLTVSEAGAGLGPLGDIVVASDVRTNTPEAPVADAVSVEETDTE